GTTRSGLWSAWGTGRPPRPAAMRYERLHEGVPGYRPGRGAWLYGALRASRIGRRPRILVKRSSCPRNRARYTVRNPTPRDDLPPSGRRCTFSERLFEDGLVEAPPSPDISSSSLTQAEQSELRRGRARRTFYAACLVRTARVCDRAHGSFSSVASRAC